MIRRRALAIGVAAVVLAAACSGGDDGDAATTSTAAAGTADPSDATTSTVPLAEGTLGAVDLATDEIAVLDAPIAFAARPSTPDLYVAEKRGTVRLVKVTTSTGSTTQRYQLQTTPVLDLTDEVIDQGERGLLGLAFSSDGRELYVYFTSQPDGTIVVLEYTLGDRTTVDLDSRRELLEVEHPASNHNGGSLVLGPDGYLYVGLGDGGGSGDPDGNAQDTEELLGKILRIDPEGGTDRDPYDVPAGNPFADGEEGAPEVWLYGVRNPWRFTFDTLTGDLWVADVGQNAWEEISLLRSTGGFDAGRGANLGWDQLEGSHEFEGDNPPGAVLPIHEYSHDDGCSITGGYVYRGSDLPDLEGSYLFADYCASDLRAIQVDGDTVIDERTWNLSLDQVQSFGQDDDGELFVLLASGPLLKLVPPDDDD